MVDLKVETLVVTMDKIAAAAAVQVLEETEQTVMMEVLETVAQLINQTYLAHFLDTVQAAVEEEHITITLKVLVVLELMLTMGKVVEELVIAVKAMVEEIKVQWL